MIFDSGRRDPDLFRRFALRSAFKTGQSQDRARRFRKRGDRGAYPLQHIMRFDNPFRSKFIIHAPQQRLGAFGDGCLPPVVAHMIDRHIVREAAKIGLFVEDRRIVPDRLDLEPQRLRDILSAVSTDEPAHLPEQAFAFRDKQTRQGDRVRHGNASRQELAHLRAARNKGTVAGRMAIQSFSAKEQVNITLRLA
eukprot:Opistho-1_new@83600